LLHRGWVALFDLREDLGDVSHGVQNTTETEVAPSAWKHSDSSEISVKLALRRERRIREPGISFFVKTILENTSILVSAQFDHDTQFHGCCIQLILLSSLPILFVLLFGSTDHPKSTPAVRNIRSA
jgi:hypothetical protein